jgi:hypothetical protein
MPAAAALMALAVWLRQETAAASLAQNQAA